MDNPRASGEDESVKILNWFIGLAALGLVMIGGGIGDMCSHPDAVIVAGGVIVGSVAICVAILAAGKH